MLYAAKRDHCLASSCTPGLSAMALPNSKRLQVFASRIVMVSESQIFSMSAKPYGCGIQQVKCSTGAYFGAKREI